MTGGGETVVEELPADNHSHSQWSWDAPAGSMEGSCARAVELGLPAIAFTEHFDLTRWVIPADVKARMTVHGHLVADDGQFDAPPLDLDGYQESLERCREKFPDLRIVSGIELGEPHWFPAQAEQMLSTGAFDRVLGSQHSVDVSGYPWIVDGLQGDIAPPGLSPEEIVGAHLAEMLELVRRCDQFEVLAHIDYAVRKWPAGAGAFPTATFEEDFREVLRALAASDRALELNTMIPMDAVILGWWRDVGGRTLTFGSDAHEPTAVGRNFARAADMARAHGFKPGRRPEDVWSR